MSREGEIVTAEHPGLRNKRERPGDPPNYPGPSAH